MSNEFEGRTNKLASANTVDLTILLDKLAEHYYSKELILFENGQDLPQQDDQALVELFTKLTDYYSFGEGKDLNPYSDKLWMVYDLLADAFNPKAHKSNKDQEEEKDKNTETIYTKSDEEIKRLYDLIMEGQSLAKEFENGMIADFEDLLKLEKEKKDTKISTLKE